MTLVGQIIGTEPLPSSKVITPNRNEAKYFFLLEFASTKQPILAFAKYAKFKEHKLWMSEDLTRWE
jgi:hypothetical protein